jgi:hypothetical protein
MEEFRRAARDVTDEIARGDLKGSKAHPSDRLPSPVPPPSQDEAHGPEKEGPDRATDRPTSPDEDAPAVATRDSGTKEEGTIPDHEPRPT